MIAIGSSRLPFSSLSSLLVIDRPRSSMCRIPLSAASCERFKIDAHEEVSTYSEAPGLIGGKLAETRPLRYRLDLHCGDEQR